MTVHKILWYLIFIIVFSVPSAMLMAQPPSADHHIHIRSEDATDAMVRILSDVEGMEGVSIEASAGAGEVLARLDSSGTRHAALLSVAYFFAMPDLHFENEELRTQNENDFVATQAEKAPDRLAGFCSVNPLSDYALREVRRCGKSGRFAGLKLQFANSDVNLRNKNDVSRLREIFREASRHNLVILAHTWTRHPDFGAQDMKIFVDKLIPAAAGVPIQIAHLGGPGTFSEVTAEAAGVFADEIESGNPAMKNVWLDISEVPHHPNRAETWEQREQMNQANRELADLIRRLGTHRVLWGTDWVAGPVQIYMAELEPMPLPDDVWEEIRDNVAPYFE